MHPLPTTLEPLRTDGLHSLDPNNISGLRKITLREIEISAENLFHEITVHSADDLFDCAAAEGPFNSPIPETGRITRAILDFDITGQPDPITVELRLLDVVSIPDAPGAESVRLWLRRSSF